MIGQDRQWFRMRAVLVRGYKAVAWSKLDKYRNFWGHCKYYSAQIQAEWHCCLVNERVSKLRGSSPTTMSSCLHCGPESGLLA